MLPRRSACAQACFGAVVVSCSRLLASEVFARHPSVERKGCQLSPCVQFENPRSANNSVNRKPPETNHFEDIMLKRMTISLALVTAAVVTAGCMATPKNLDLSLAKKSAGGVYYVELLPPAQTPAINQMHSWTVKLATAEGAPVRGAKFLVDGGMPQHGHGLPTQPRVTREIEAGSYALDGMKFSMTGWWEMKLSIDGPQGADKVTFNTVVNNPSGR